MKMIDWVDVKVSQAQPTLISCKYYKEIYKKYKKDSIVRKTQNFIIEKNPNSPANPLQAPLPQKYILKESTKIIPADDKCEQFSIGDIKNVCTKC